MFLASPSDVPEDREAVRRAAQTVNDGVAKPFGFRLHVEGWEQVQPGLGRPQALINPLVDDCDVFVGPADVPLLVDAAGASTLRRADAREVLAAVCRAGGPATASSLLEADDDIAAAGAAYLAGDPATNDDTLSELLHHAKAVVRQHAIDAFLGRADDRRLERLLDEYPRHPLGYYYDVVAALDWRLYAYGAAAHGATP